MPTIAERLETATALLESQVPLLTAGISTCTTKATEASASAGTALASKNAAETAQAAAETAQAAAETARDNAQGSAEAADASASSSGSFASAAETHSSNAATSAGNAGTSATNASNSASAASSSASAAASSASAASASQTAAATSATNAASSATAAATSATNAATSASAAATSATTALNAIASTFKGGVAGASVPATSTAAGDYYRVTSAGTSQSKTWATGDLAIYNGTSGNWTQISGNVTDPASLANKTNALAPRGGVAFDGTSGARVFGAMTGQGIGTDAFSIVVVVRCAPTNSNGGLVRLTSDPANVTGQQFEVTRQFNSSQHLVTTLYGATNVDGRYYRYDNFFTTNAGKDVVLTVTRTTGGVVTTYSNGVPLTPSAEVTIGTPPAWTGTINNTHFAVGNLNSSIVGSDLIRTVSVYNLALDAASVQEIFELGGAVPERFKWAAQQIFGGGSSLAVGSIDGTSIPEYGGFTPTLISGTRTGGAGSYVLRASGGGNIAFRVNAPAGSTVVVSFWVRTDGGTPSAGYRLTPRAAVLGTGTVAAGTSALGLTGLDGTWRQFSTTFTPSENVGSLMFTNTAGATWLEFDDVSVRVFGGAVVHLPFNEGAGLTARDQSTNNLHATLTATGVSWVQPNKGVVSTGPIVTTDTTASTSTTTGSATFGGGIGVAGAGYFGGNLVANTGSGSTTFTLRDGVISKAAGAGFVVGSDWSPSADGAINLGTTSLRWNQVYANSLTGGASGLTLNAGGTNQNITLTPSGTGATVSTARALFGAVGLANTPGFFGIAAGSDTTPALGFGNNSFGWGFFERSTEGNFKIRRLTSGAYNDVLTFERSTGKVTVDSTTTSTSTSTGALTVAGGLGVAGSLWGGGQINLTGSQTIYGQWNSTASDARFEFQNSGTRTGLLGWNASNFTIQSDNGRGLQLITAGATRLGIDSGGVVSVTAGTPSTSTTTGALVVSGGLGVAGALNAGGDISARSASTGAAASVIAENTTVDGGTGTGSYTQFRMQGAASKFLGSLSAYGDEYADANLAGRVVLTTSSDLSNGLRLRVAGVNAVDVSNTGVATFASNVASTGGSVEVSRTGANDAFMRISADAGRSRNLSFNTGVARRWIVAANSTAESGSNAGSDFTITRYSDADAGLGIALTITRSTGDATFSGQVNAPSLRVNTTNGTAVDLIASATATLDFPSISAGGQQDLTITVTGASTGDVVQLGLPAAPTAGVVFNAFVSAANTVTVRASNITGSPIDPASATYRVAVMSF